jgi:hypothetical protein
LTPYYITYDIKTMEKKIIDEDFEDAKNDGDDLVYSCS